MTGRLTDQMVAAGHGVLSTGLPGPVLIAGALGLVAGGIAIGLGVARVDRRNYDLEVPDTEPALPSNVVRLEDDERFPVYVDPAVETHVQQALAIANPPAVQPTLRAISGGAAGGVL